MKPTDGAKVARKIQERFPRAGPGLPEIGIALEFALFARFD